MAAFPSGAGGHPERQALTSEQRRELIGALGFFLALSPEEVEQRLDSTQYDPFEPVPVASELTPDQSVYITEHPEQFPHAELEQMPVRTYPQGFSAAHVLGFIGKVSAEDLAARPGQRYQADDLIG